MGISAPAPHSVLFRVRICLFPPFESTPLSPDWQHFWTPPFAAFRRLFLPWRPPYIQNTAQCTPYIVLIYFITPFLNFSGVQRERERKTTSFFKEISGWKVKYPPFFFLQFSGRTLSLEKYPFTGDFGNTHAVPPTPEWGGGGGGSGSQRLKNWWCEIRWKNKQTNTKNKNNPCTLSGRI